MNCKKCGNDISEGLNFCPSCGAEINKEVAEGTVQNTDPADVTGVESAAPAAAAPKPKKNYTGTIIGIIAAVLVVVIRLLGLVSGATPKDLEYNTYVLDQGDGFVYTVVYGYKDDVIYTETDIYVYDLTVGEPWTEEEIADVIAMFDEYAEYGKDLDCYEYYKEVTDTQLRFEDRFFDLGDSDNLKDLVYLGWFTFDGGYEDGALLSMELTEESHLADGWVKQ